MKDVKYIMEFCRSQCTNGYIKDMGSHSEYSKDIKPGAGIHKFECKISKEK